MACVNHTGLQNEEWGWGPGYYIHCMAAYTEYDMTINPFAVGIATYVHDAHVVVI